MRTHKRFIALVLVVVMAFSGAVMSVASAAKLTDADKYANKGALTKLTLAYAIDVLQQLGVVAGVSNVTDDEGKVTEYTFDGESLVTRQQFALFTARIATALPGMFVVDPNSEMKTNTKFKDLVDKTYTLAIDHCYGEGYILGRDEENTVFDPLGNITFAEAVTMLTRALGYTGLVYPTGFMTKAADRETRLIGEYADFPMNTVALNTPITRAQMAMLLWNFLLSERYELEMVYNGAKGEWDSVRIAHPILATFGIKRTIGYVTAVPNWSASLDVLDAYGNNVNLIGGGLASANTQFQVYRDICVSPQDGSARIITTMDKLGLGDYKADPLELLGLKVTVYEDKRVNAEFNINIPTIVYGSKIDIDIEEVDGAFNTGDSGITDSLNVPFPAIEDLALNREDFFNAYVPNLYTFNGDAVLSGIIGTNKGAAALTAPVAPTAPTPVDYTQTNANLLLIDQQRYAAEKEIYDAAVKKYNEDLIEYNAASLLSAAQIRAFEDTKYFAQKAANKTNYKLELVYNGDYSDGTPEYFYIFRPYKVGVYFQDAGRDNNKFFTTAVVTNDVTRPGDKKVEHAANFVDEDIKELVLNKGYLYTYYGANLDIYAELDEDAGAIPVAANMTAKVVNFKLATGNNKQVYFNSGDPKALGAWPDANNVNPDGKGVYTIYYDGDAALLARRTSDGPDEYQTSQYVVILSMSLTREITLRDKDTQARIGQGYRAYVLNAQTGKQEWIVIHMIDGEDDDVTTLAKGTPVRLVNVGNDYYDVATKGDENFITHVKDKEYAGFRAPALVTDINANTNLISALPQIWGTPTTTGNISARIDTRTNIVIYGQVQTSSGVADGAVRYTGNAAGLKYLRDDIIKAGRATEIVAVGVGAPATGYARFVYVKATGILSGPVASVDNYAMVLTHDAGLTSGGYNYGTAKLADGKDVNIASKTPADIQRGRLVELTSEKVTSFDGTEYTVVKTVDYSLDLNGVDIKTANNKFDAFFATPTSINRSAGANLQAKGDLPLSYSANFGFELVGPTFGDALAATNSFAFDKNLFKVVVAYTDDKGETILNTDGRPTAADANVKEQFIPITQTEYQKILDAKGKIYIFAYTAGNGTADEAVVFATMLIDLRGITEADTTSAGWAGANAAAATPTKTRNNPFGWRD
ncbi:MAG: hypothetical protein FWG34_02785 [Oscillospiraceae bacterium]|nr:hypothetical protein [Oscillospiraceae bacterium]